MPRRSFTRSVASVFTGTFVAQIISLSGTLVLARIFSPSSFGIYSIWLGLVMILGVVLTCRFEMALAIEPDGDPRRYAVIAIMKTIAIVAFVFALLLFLGNILRFDFLAKLAPGLIALLIPTAGILAGNQTLQNWAAADGRYRHLSVLRIVQTSSVVLLQIGFGWLANDPLELACGYLGGTLLVLIIAIILFPLNNKSAPRNPEPLTSFWRRQRRFSMFSLPADLISASTAQLPIMIVAARYGSEASGLLAMALRMIGAPMSLLSSSFLDVFKRHAALAYRERGECRAEYLRSLGLLFLIATSASAIIGIGAKPFFAVAFAASWTSAGALTLLLLPRFALGFMASPLSYIVYVVGKQELDLLWQLALLAMTLATLSAANSFHAALLWYSIGYGCLYLAYLWMSYRFSCGASKL
jgi:O-antigen/teichoic acid export membrane protein